MGSKTGSERRHIFFAGRVQGVGFRYTTRSIASGYAVDGFVKNLHDGRVELLVEGTPAELDAFSKELEARMERYIVEQNSSRLPATGEFDGFEIRF